MRHPDPHRTNRPRPRVGVLLPALLLMAASARGGDYHDGATLRCTDCHVVHASSTPGGDKPLSPEAERLLGQLGPEAAGFVGPDLLKPDINDLCLSCHDDSPRAADVLGPNLGSGVNDVREAGALNRLGLSGQPGTGHTLGSLDQAPGSNPPWGAEDENGLGVGLNCLNCHAHHGKLQTGADTYRNLRPDAGHSTHRDGLVSYNHESPGANNLGRDVFVRRSLDYDESAVDFNEPDARDSAMGRFCASCHDQLHGRPGSDPNIGGQATDKGFTAFVRHPTGGVDIGAVGGEWSSLRRFASLKARVKVQSQSGQWDPPGSDSSPSCVSCHKAHGNRNAFGLIYRSGQGAPTEEGDTKGGDLTSLCGQCHVQGTPFGDG